MIAVIDRIDDELPEDEEYEHKRQVWRDALT